MFIDKEKSAELKKTGLEAEPKKPLLGRKEMLMIVSVALVLLMIGAGVWYYASFLKSKNKAPEVSPEPVIETGLGTLTDKEIEERKKQEAEEDMRRQENLTFGSFYKSLNNEAPVKITGVKLPLNVKSQVVNYYETARKINLDPIVNNLNQNGFGVIDNPFQKSSNNFFAIYYELNQRSVPVVLTSDFLVYYYQNSLKQIYKEIEASYFYDNIWKVTNELYTTANGRYQERRKKLGVASDALLEAERLEAAYFATALMLLRPEKDQINSTEDINDSNKFKPSEATRFDFTMPAYLNDDLNRELRLIDEAGQVTKSPLLLYERNYQDFKVPPEYSKSAKLRNFYLASRWYGSLFPLYFKDSACQNCLLDKEDWIINQSAAHLIASDLSASQSLKNDWAKIYKVISFFSGLRSELTYLHYQNVRNDIFKDKSLEELFGPDSFERLIELRDALAKLEFKATEGAYNRQLATDKPILGMRLLQTAYWPSQAFYNQLTNAAVGDHKQPLNTKGESVSYLTTCQSKAKLYRCRGLGFDILNIVLDRLPKSKFILDNINYDKYNTQVEAIRNELKAFTPIDWHNNNFWTTLSLVGAYANDKMAVLPYDNTEQWFERKLSTSLASLTNFYLAPDTWTVARERVNNGLEVSGSLASLNYIEPNIKLADELVANTKMLFEALASLGVVKDNDDRFVDLLNKMETSGKIMRQELAKENISNDDYQFISDFISQFKLDQASTKTRTVEFFDPTTKQAEKIKQTIESPRLMLFIYEKDGKNIMTAGPVFSYKEQ